jgi:hypothetical protein
VLLERNFSRALEKAVVCRETVYRGLSAGTWCPERIAYLRELIHGPDEYTIPTHDSASTLRRVASERTYSRKEDEERNLSILLKVPPCTARYLRPLTHKHGDEAEVVLIAGTKYVKRRVVQLPNPKPELELFEICCDEVA